MKTVTTRLGKSGRLVIPAEIRHELGVRAGDPLVLRIDEEGLHVSTPVQALARAQAFVRQLGIGRDLAAELAAERRREAAAEAD